MHKPFSVLKKLLIVKEFIDGKGGFRYLGRKHGVSHESVRRWVRLYRSIGIDFFLNKHETFYPPRLKELAVQEYLKGYGSLEKICQKFKITYDHLLRRWIKEYNSHEKLNSISKGEYFMAKYTKTTLAERIKIAEFCIENGHNYKLAASTFSVSYQQARLFTKKFEENGQEGLKDNRGKTKPEEEMNETELLKFRIRQLEKKNQELEMENDILKKLKEIEGRWESK